MLLLLLLLLIVVIHNLSFGGTDPDMKPLHHLFFSLLFLALKTAADW